MHMKLIAVTMTLTCMSGMMFAQYAGEIHNKVSLAEALKNPMIVVDFHGENWCAPCRKMGPVFKSVAQKFDNVKFYKCNVDEYEISGITGVPTFIFYKSGTEVKRFSGVRSEADFIREVKTVFSLDDKNAGPSH